MSDSRYIRWFEELGMDDVPIVGGKNASLGEMYRELAPLGVSLPNGFAVTAEAFRTALTEADAWGELHSLLDGLDKSDVRALAAAGRRAREIVYAAGLTDEMREQILQAYRKLVDEYGEDLSVACAQLGHGGRPADCQLRWSARHLSQRPWRGDADRRGEALQRLAVHRPGDLLPHGPGLRPLQGRSVGLCHEDGARRSGLQRRHVLHRYRGPVSATRCSSPAPTGWARTWCRGPSIRTSSTSTSRLTRRDIAACCGGCWATRASRWSMRRAAPASR